MQELSHFGDLAAPAAGRALRAFTVDAPPHTPGPRRVIRAAAVLAERYGNGDVAAYGRLHFAEGRMWSGKFRRVHPSERRDHFWFCVGRALGAAYGRRGAPTDYERAMRREIDAARAAIAKATGSAA